MRRSTLARLVVALVVLSTTAPVAAQSSSPDVTVDDIAYTGDGDVSPRNETQYLWNDTAHEFTATLAANESVEGTVCLDASRSGSNQTVDLACASATVPAGNDTATVPAAVETWPSNATGQYTVHARFVPTNASEAVAEASTGTTVVGRQGDLDDDGLVNEREVTFSTGLAEADTDGDGLADGAEVRTYDTAPTDRDSDDDGLSDYAEIDTHGTDPTSADTDDDGLPDAAELEHGTNPTSPDSDGDGLDDGAEVNVHGTDPTDPDTDGDGLADATEAEELDTSPTDADTDDDGLSDALEVNNYDTDPTRIDTDGDGLADGAEVNDHQTDPTSVDTDGDGLTDDEEVDTFGTNPADADTDGDGLEDGAEVHEHDTDPRDADSDDDGTPDGAEVDQGLLDRLGAPLVVLVGLGMLVVAVRWRWVDRDGLPSSLGARLRALFERQPPDTPATGRLPAGDDGTSEDSLGFQPEAVGDTVAEATPAGQSAPVHPPTADLGGDGPTAGESGVGRPVDDPVADSGGDAAADSGNEAPGSSDETAGGAGPAADAETLAADGADETLAADGVDETLAADGVDETLADVPPEFMTNEQRVLTLLDEHGGRMDQSAVVEETGWSKSKVSRVLSEMAEDGHVVKIDVGAGNVVAVPEAVPPGVESSLDG